MTATDLREKVARNLRDVAFRAMQTPDGMIPACMLWNWVAVGKFHAPHLTYWEMVGVWLLVTAAGQAWRFAVK